MKSALVPRYRLPSQVCSYMLRSFAVYTAAKMIGQNILLSIVSIFFATSFVAFANDVMEEGGADAIVDGREAAADFIKSTMDTSISACKDFNGFKCGKTKELAEKLDSDGGSFSNWDVLTTNFTRKLVRLLDTFQPEDTTVPDVMRKLKTVYDKCLTKNEESSKNQSIKDAMSFAVNDFGGIPLLDSSWEPPSQSIISLALAVQKRFGVEFGIRLSPGYDTESGGSSKVVLQARFSSERLSPQRTADIIKSYAQLAGYETASEESIQEQIEGMEELDSELDSIVYGTSGSYQTVTKTVQDIYEIDPSAGKAALEYGLTNSSVIQTIRKEWKLFKKLKDVWGKYSKYRTALQNFLIGAYLKQVTGLLDLTDLIYETSGVYVYGYVGLGLGNSTTSDNEPSETKGEIIGEIPKNKQDCVELLVVSGYTGGLMENTVLRLFIETYGPNETESLKLRNLVDLVTEELRKQFFGASWLSYTSKIQALNKLSAIVPRIAYPLWIMNNTAFNAHHSNLGSVLESHSYLRVLGQAKSNYWLNNLRLAYQPISEDFNDFGMTTFLTNAWYDSGRNAFSLSLAFLQPPFYRPDYPPALIYATIGAVIGHEIIHGFDTDGVLTTASGLSSSLLSKTSLEQFKEKAQCVKDMYSGFCFNTTKVFGEKKRKEFLCVDGDQTASENIADIDGLKAAYQAYQNFLRDYADKGVEDDSNKPAGLESNSWEQIFFLAYGSLWCQHYSYSDLEMIVNYDSHSPTPSRINGTLQNMKEFSDAFHCPIGSNMNPKDKCFVWSDK